MKLSTSRRVCSSPLWLEALEDRLPPGDLVGTGLLGTAWLSASDARWPAEAPRSSGSTGAAQPDVPAAGSLLTAAPADEMSWTSARTAAGSAATARPWDDPLRPMANGRPQTRNVFQAAEPATDRGSAQRRDEAGVRLAMAPGAVGSGPISSTGGLEDQAQALTLFVQQSAAALAPHEVAAPRHQTGPDTAGEFSVVATYPAPHGLALPSDTPVFVVFSKPVDVNTLGPATFAVFGRMSGMASGSFEVSEDGTYFVFWPARPFALGEAVEVMLTHDLAAVDGTTLRAAGYAWTFWVQAGAGGGTDFPEAARLDTGTNVRTYGGQATDLNGDGWVDLAVVNEVAADMRVFLNNGDGTFGAFTRYAIGRGASPNLAGDFNRDGLTDIATSNYDDNSMSVLLGNGDGTFQPAQRYSTGSTPAGIAALDVNGDGAVELVIVTAVGNTLSMFLNNGDGTFQPQVPIFNAPGARLYGLAAVDMNNDGIMDLVAGAQQTRRVYVLLGDGAGGFFQSTVQDAGGGPWVLRAADVNGDGYADVQIANTEGNMAILLGDGAGGLLNRVTYPAGNRPVSVSLGDLNGDGSLDVVISNFGSRDYYVFTNDGTGQFTRTSTLRARLSGSCAIILDYNNDGLLDIGGVDEIEDEIALFVNNG